MQRKGTDNQSLPLYRRYFGRRKVGDDIFHYIYDSSQGISNKI
nr:MAG TPA: hypothetical protein [Caudoviricetes sp.]